MSPASAELARYEAYLREELPLHLRQELNQQVNELFGNIEESLRNRLSNIVRDLQRRIFQNYVQSRRSQEVPTITSNPAHLQTNELAASDEPPENPNETNFLGTDDFSGMHPDSVTWLWDDVFADFDGTVIEMPSSDGTISSYPVYGSLKKGCASSTTEKTSLQNTSFV